MRPLSLFARWLGSPRVAGVAIVLCLSVLLGAVAVVALPWAVLQALTVPGFALAFLWLVWATWRACRPVRPSQRPRP